MRSDEELMAAYVRGDTAAFRELFERYAPVLLRMVRYQLKRQEDAVDLVQQTFLQLHRGRNDFREGELLRPWLLTIAMNLKREYFRRWSRRKEVPAGEGEPDVPAPASPHERTEASDEVWFAMERLPADQREVIALHWFADVPLAEVAEIVGASLSAVKVRAHRGYAAMRRILTEEGANAVVPRPAEAPEEPS